MLLVGIPVFIAINAVHERVAGIRPGTLARWLYLGMAFAVAAVVRFLAHLVWDALELSARRR